MGALGGSDVWLAKTIADLASPICRCVDEPHPTQAIVRACSKVASRNGAAGYKVMRLIARAMDIDAGPAERTPRDGNNGNRELLTICRPVLIQSAAVLEAVKARPGNV